MPPGEAFRREARGELEDLGHNGSRRQGNPLPRFLDWRSVALSDGVLQGAELFDGGGDSVSGLEPGAGGCAAAAGCAHADHVAGFQREEPRNPRDRLGHGEDHLAGRRMLAELAVDVECHFETSRIVDLVGCDQPWTDHGEAVAPFPCLLYTSDAADES